MLSFCFGGIFADKRQVIAWFFGLPNNTDLTLKTKPKINAIKMQQAIN
jgi:hypothetical protein